MIRRKRIVIYNITFLFTLIKVTILIVLVFDLANQFMGLPVYFNHPTRQWQSQHLARGHDHACQLRQSRRRQMGGESHNYNRNRLKIIRLLVINYECGDFLGYWVSCFFFLKAQSNAHTYMHPLNMEKKKQKIESTKKCWGLKRERDEPTAISMV